MLKVPGMKVDLDHQGPQTRLKTYADIGHASRNVFSISRLIYPTLFYAFMEFCSQNIITGIVKTNM
jgi:hypothetical protein